MVDYVADLRRFTLAGRTVEALRFRIIGNLRDHIHIGLRECNVKADGTAIVDLTPDQAVQIANELIAQARQAKRSSLT